MFPFNIQGEITLPSIAPGQVPIYLSQVERAAGEKRACNIRKTESLVTFRGGMFRLVMNWNIFVPITRGIIEVLPGTPGVVRYYFSCTEMLITVSVMVAIFAFCLLQPGLSTLGVVLPIVAWLWLFGMNYATAAFRLPGFVREALR